MKTPHEPPATPSPNADSEAPAPDARVNVYQVAALAGVSPGTVSRVLNNRGRVHVDTRQRVFDAARGLGFRPQVQVRAKQIAVVVDPKWSSMVTWGYYQEVRSCVAFELLKRGLGMILPTTPDALIEKHVDGVIVIGEYPGLRPVLRKLRGHASIVLTDDLSPEAAEHWVVRCNHRGIGELAAERFAKTGRRRLGLVGSAGSQERVILEGYKRVMRDAGVKLHDDLFVMRNEEVTFYSAVTRVVRLGADAILIPGSNYEAMEGMNVLTNILRLNIPHDIALIGGEIHGVSGFLAPPMTTVQQPLMELATRAVDTVLALICGDQPPRDVELPVRLIPRESA